MLERENLGRFIDASQQILLAFERRPLGADQSEHHDLSLGNEAQGLEGAGTLIIVFEQETIHRQLMKEPLGDGVVAALGIPMTAIVAAAEMNGERDIRDGAPQQNRHCRRSSDAVSICAGSTRSSFSIHAVHLGSR